MSDNFAYVRMNFDEYDNLLATIPENFPHETGQLNEKNILLIDFFNSSFVGIEFADKYEAGSDYDDNYIFVILNLKSLIEVIEREIRKF